MTNRAIDNIADVEVLSSWEGQAEHAPGVLFEESLGEGMLGGEAAVIELAAWVAVVAVSGVIGNAAYEAIKLKVLGVLTAWRRRKGQARLDELKQEVFEAMQKHRAKGRLTEEELRTQIEALFAQVHG